MNKTQIDIDIDKIKSVQDFNNIILGNIDKGIFRYHLYSSSGRCILSIPNQSYAKLDTD